MTTCQPRVASALAAQSPTPDDAPVMMTTGADGDDTLLAPMLGPLRGPDADFMPQPRWIGKRA
jgi:hypothetical protein